jgi:hypothetical protein
MRSLLRPAYFRTTSGSSARTSARVKRPRCDGLWRARGGLAVLATGSVAAVVCALLPASPAAAVSAVAPVAAAGQAAEAPPAPPTTYSPMPADQVAALKAQALAMGKPDTAQARPRRCYSLM